MQFQANTVCNKCKLVCQEHNTLHRNCPQNMLFKKYKSMHLYTSEYGIYVYIISES
jgi:hypothetical protein